MKKILSAIVIVMVLGADLSRAQLNIYKGKLTTSLNANGNSISNVVSITDTNGNPVIGGTGTGISTNGGSGIGNIFTNTILNNASTPTAFTFTNGSGIPAQVEAYTGPLSGLSAFTTNSSGGWIDLFDIVGSGANKGVVLNSGSFQGNGSGLTGVTNSQAGSFNATGSSTVTTLSTAAAQGVVSTNLQFSYVDVLQPNNTRTNYLSLESACSNALPGSIITCHGSFLINAVAALPYSSVLNLNGSTFTNMLDGQVKGAAIYPANNCTINGPGVIWPYPLTNVQYSLAIGFNGDVGQIPATNVIIKNGIVVYAETDGYFFKRAAGQVAFGVIISNCKGIALPNSSWDNLAAQDVTGGTNCYLTVDGYYGYTGPNNSSFNQSQIRGVYLNSVQAVFRNCTLIDDSTITNTLACITVASSSASAPGTLEADNCSFIILGTNGTSNISGAVSGTGSRIRYYLNNCTFTSLNNPNVCAFNVTGTFANGVFYNFNVNDAAVTNLILGTSSEFFGYSGGNLFANYGSGAYTNMVGNGGTYYPSNSVTIAQITASPFTNGWTWIGQLSNGLMYVTMSNNVVQTGYVGQSGGGIVP